MADKNNTQPQADNATATAQVTAPLPEFGPAGPEAGEEPEPQDSEFIMNTLFGDGSEKPPVEAGKKAGAAQADGSQAPSGQSSAVAPASGSAPAANGEEGSPSEPGPSPSQPATQEQTPAGGQTPQTQDRGQQPPSSSEPPAQTGLSLDDRLKLANADALRRQNEELLQRLAALEKGGQPQTAGTGEAPPSQQSGAPQEQVHLTVPPQLAEAIFNDENPAQSKQAMDLLVSAVATAAVNHAISKIGPMVDQKLQQFAGSLQMAETAKTQEGAYFERFPAHNNPLYRPLIQETVEQIYKEMPHLSWDENTMDAVGARVQAKLQALGISVGMQPAPQGGNEAPPKPNGGQKPNKPAPMLDTTSRGGVPADAGDFITATLG